MTMRPLDLYLALLLVCAALALHGCSQLASTASSDGAQEEQDNTVINWADYEDFNADLYGEARPSTQPDIIHDVPSELLRGGGVTGQHSGEQAGFRISIFSTLEPMEADRATAEAIAWWKALESDGKLEDVYTVQEWEPPVYQDFRAPYYRVRIGNFASRAEAERMLRIVEDRYPDAYIVPDQVKIR